MDDQLVVRAQHGDKDAFEALVDVVGGRLYAIAYSILRERQLAQDVAQETLLTAWRELPRLRERDRFEAWTCRILVRSCRREARRAARWVPAAVSPGREPAVGDDTQQVLLRDQLERGFRRLTVDQRAVVVMSYYLDLPQQEVADRLGVPTATVGSRLRRALEVLHAALDADARTLVPGLYPAAQTNGSMHHDAVPNQEAIR